MGQIGVRMVLVIVETIVLVIFHGGIDLRKNFGSFHGVARNVSLLRLIKQGHHRRFHGQHLLTIGVVVVHRGAAFHLPLLDGILVAGDGGVLVFGKELELTAVLAGFELDDVRDLGVVVAGLQHGLIASEDSRVDQHIGAVNILAKIGQIQGLLLDIFT